MSTTVRDRGMRWTVVLSMLLVLGAPVVTEGEEDGAPALVKLWALDVGDGASAGGFFRMRPAGADLSEETRVEARRGEKGVFAERVLPAGSRWRVCADIPNRWVTCEDLVAGDGADVVLSAWASSRVEGEFEPGEALPERLILRFSAVDPPPRSGLDQVSVGCALEERKWSCEVPALDLDLELRPKSFVPIYRFGVSLTGKKSWNFGRTKLRRGGSLVARIEPGDGSILKSKARARLVPFSAGASGAVRPGVRPRGVSEAEVRENGFVQFGALPAGIFSVEVHAAGFASAVVGPFQVWEGREVRVKDVILLERPLTVSVQVQPPTDWLERAWTLRLSRASQLTGSYDERPVFDGPLGPDGTAEIPEQRPGSYKVQIFDSVGNPLWGERDRFVSGPGAADIFVNLDLIVVRGELSYRDEPISGSLWFGLKFGGVRSEMAADLEGEFTGLVAEEGWWYVEVEVPELELSEYRTRVEVSPDSRGEAWVEIAIPDTEVSGRVVDPDGRPVEGADVSVGTSEAGRQVRTDSEGRFSAIAIEDGVAGVVAVDRVDGRERRSDAVEVFVEEGQVGPEVELVLREMKSWAGRVISERVPVPGAVVEVMVTEPRSLAGRQTVRTDAEGRFEIEVREEARRFFAAVAAPGGALKAFEFPRSEILELVVPSEGGVVRMDLSELGGQREKQRHGGWGLTQDGLPLSWGMLDQWSRGHGVVDRGDRIDEVPRLAAGHYRLCRFGAEPRIGWELAAPTVCDEGFLSAGGELNLRLPRQAGADSEEAK